MVADGNQCTHHVGFTMPSNLQCLLYSPLRAATTLYHDHVLRLTPQHPPGLNLSPPTRHHLALQAAQGADIVDGVTILLTMPTTVAAKPNQPTVLHMSQLLSLL